MRHNFGQAPQVKDPLVFVIEGANEFIAPWLMDDVNWTPERLNKGLDCIGRSARTTSPNNISDQGESVSDYQRVAEGCSENRQ